jgi:predicted glutamine amidotransferase
MCRWMMYLGPELALSQLLTEPAHSLIHQSYKAQLREEPLNGDGFGVAWYRPDRDPEAALFRSVGPAWSDVNLLHLARVTTSRAVFAHVRAASVGNAATLLNCHPFSWERFVFMHNGTVGGFSEIKRELRASLSDEAWDGVLGNTDTEHVFALFQDRWRALDDDMPALERMADALAATIAHVVQLARSVGGECSLNLCVSDGERAVVSRFSSGERAAESLFVSAGRRYVCEEGVCRMLEDPGEGRATVVASEPLGDDPSWQEIPPGHLLLLDGHGGAEPRALPV